MPDDHKYTQNLKIEAAPEPNFVSISLLQHVGVMCKPVVKVGQHVLEGQLIGDIFSKPGCPVHASVSGTVKRIEDVTTPNGGTSYNIVIENDFQHTLSPDVQPFGKKLSDATFEEICAVIRNAGIAGMGGTAFPTHMKLAAAKGRVRGIIINCCECEPFLCATHRIVVENPQAIVNGAKILMMALGVRDTVLAVSKDKKDEIAALNHCISNSEMISIETVSEKYPQGSEKQLVYSLTKLVTPLGKSPIEVGYVVFNAETCAAVYDAFSKGMPLIKRVVTVDGDCIASPRNLLVPIGTPAADLIGCCDGLCKPPKKMILGGPMMGQAQWDVETPITKSTSALIVLSDFFDRESKLPKVCIKCGRCVDACPMGLMPYRIASYAQHTNVDMPVKLHPEACIECGSCSYVCPGGVPVAQLVEKVKLLQITERRKSDTD